MKMAKIMKVGALAVSASMLVACASQSTKNNSNKETCVASESIGGYTVKICSDDRKLSKDRTAYEGHYYFEVNKGDKQISKQDIIGYHYLPKEFTIQVADYNEDGRDDFALGGGLEFTGVDKVPEDMNYDFYTVSKNGEIEILNRVDGTPATIYARSKEVSPKFTIDNHKVVFDHVDDEKEEVVSETLTLAKEIGKMDTEDREKYGFLKCFEEDSVVYDEVEMVQVGSERAKELGITEETSPNGVHFYNEKKHDDTMKLSEQCVFLLQDKSSECSYCEVSAKEFFDTVMESRNEDGYSTGLFVMLMEDNQVVSIRECKVP